ncbi:PulJ/GspJ family protein [Clostridium disporicum]|uniref:Prepilin-type N-terminal cleavage/methylation domain n=1 Tax=Clostridium disporicum TaxID=84024 RepID=A0A174HPW5_9CLOT|nr:type II secretion system protein [Clostridium disporicum]CUO75566.1 prepilin-type N-terminal cleavage/methylation domain [Clostridium disporicum]
MSSMMEFTAEKTPLTKNIDKKKGMTLVEIMAAMAILSILFVAISGLMINTVKIESRADKILETNNYLKSALLVFDEKMADVSEYIVEKTIEFSNVNEMQRRIVNKDYSSTGKYSMNIKSELQSDGLYKVIATMQNKNIEETKILIVSK